LTDGFGPFKRRNKAAWPLILFNYNLPPEERFHKEHIISLGSIPKKPLDLDSFLWPFMQELLQLAIGVSAFDALSQAIFILHAFLIVVFGDIPAVSMIMHMKGHNTTSPCRMCEIQGICKPGTNTHYVPLNRSFFPGSQDSYDPSALPLHDHASFLEQATTVQSATTNKDFDRLSTKFGIKGVPLLSALSSLSFLTSFPYDFMHLIWANLIPNLILLVHQFLQHLDLVVSNIALEKSQMIAETYSIWTLHLAPVLLKGHFLNEYYYKHFIKLVQLLMCCVDLEIMQEQIDDLDQNFQDWVLLIGI
jgi:hypothetical protein